MCCMDLINSESHREIQYPDLMFAASQLSKSVYTRMHECVVCDVAVQ